MIRDIIFLLFIIAILLNAVLLLKQQKEIISDQNKINYNVSVIAEQLKIDNLIIK